MTIAGARIGKRFEDCTFENFDAKENSKALKACKRVAAGESSGVLLFGPVGRGKTHLLVSLAKEVHQEGVGEFIEDEGHMATWQQTQKERIVEYWPVLDLAGSLREEIRLGEHELMSRCLNCYLLILDDLGAERSTDFVLEAIERIIDYRYREEMPIAIGTNLLPDGIAQKYGGRAISRWAQSCGVNGIVEMVGVDHRLKEER